MAAVVAVDVLEFFFMLVYMGLITFIAFSFPFVEKRFFMGTLGKLEYRNLRGILGVIESPEGFVGIEKMRFRFPGLLQSVATPPRFGRYFFVGEEAVLKPVGSIRLAFIDGRSSTGAPAHTIATVEAVRGMYTPNSDAISEKIEQRAEEADKAAQRAADEAQRRSPGVKVEARRSRFSMRRQKAPKRAVPRVKDYEELALDWAKTRYFPTLEYTRKVQQMDGPARLALQAKDPAQYAVWKQAYVEDQVNALLFQADRDNQFAIMTEIQNPGVLRKTRVLETYDMGADGLTVQPKWTTVQETRPMPRDLRLKWFTGITREFAKDPLAWPVEIGGRAVDVRALADFKLSMLGQGQVHDMLQNEHDIVTDDQAGRDAHLIKIAIAVMLIMLGAGAFLYLLLHG